MASRISIFNLRSTAFTPGCDAVNCIQHQTRAGNRAFSFTEMLFAIMILGIGFIMLAAIFPVGLSQSKSNYEESVGAGIGRSASHTLENLAREGTFLPTPPFTAPTGTLAVGESITLGSFISFRDRRLPTASWRWNQVCEEMVIPSDPRFAWSVLYQRKVKYTNNTGGPQPISTGNFLFGQATVNNLLSAAAEPVAQVIVIGTRINNRSEYVRSDYYVNNTPAPGPPVFYQIEPKPVRVKVTRANADGTGEFVATFDAMDPAEYAFPALTGTEYSEALKAIGPGSYLVISDDCITAPISAAGRMNGRICRVGNNVEGNTWELSPGNEFTPDFGPDAVANLVANTATTPEEYDINAIGTTGTTSGLDNTTGTDSSPVQVRNYAVGYVIGKGYSVDSSTPVRTPGSLGSVSVYEGGVQDVCVYTSFVAVKK